MASPPAPPLPPLWIVPGERLVLIWVRVGAVPTLLPVAPGRLVDGLRTARALLSFGEVQRDEDRLDEILPWTGNV